VIPEAPYLFSVAALSVSLAGFAGLVAAFRRGAEWTAMDVFRLREIGEFGLGNALVALVVIPLAASTGDFAAGVRWAAALGVAFVVLGSFALSMRRGRLAVAPALTWYVLAAIIDVGAVASGITALVSGAVAFFEWQLLFLLARPMLAFVLVLASLRHE
jgi:hypothetical protein